ncbi:MAG: aldehyde dehydrogenase family protein, partial [Lachnospiraceae bacterium]
MEIEKLARVQKQYFESGRTLSLKSRLKALDKLKEVIQQKEPQIKAALKKDLNKSGFESYMTEIGLTLSELSYTRQHLSSWMKNKTTGTPITQFPSKSYVISEPFGVVLIMSPWNYPFMLCMEPLIGALAAGNCCILKPSNDSPHVSGMIKEIIEKIFPQEYVAVVEGGREENRQLLEQKFDYIFFTGGVKVGKLVMEKAAQHLTPVTLELGGKSPCIIEESADLKLAAKRLVFGKFLNAGQTCVAPDYVLVQSSVKKEFLRYVVGWIKKMYGNELENKEDYPKIINEKHFQRICSLIKGEKVVIGGTWNKETLQIAPTVLVNVTSDAPIMKEEIFGPVLPILEFDTIKEAKAFVRARPKPLALYL